jgi:cytochrome c biogenesis protein
MPELRGGRTHATLAATWPSRLVQAGRVLASLRLTMVLLPILILGCVVGAVLPQATVSPGPPSIYDSYVPLIRGMAQTLGLGDVFHSWWFLTVVGLFAANLVACMATRLGRNIRLLRNPIRYAPQGQVPDSEVTIELSEDTAIEKLRARSFRIRRYGKHVVGERNRLSLLIPDIVHLGVIIVLAGMLLSLFRFQGSLLVGEQDKGKVFAPASGGKAGSVRGAKFGLRVDDFGFDLYAGSQVPRAYWSTVAVLDDENPIIQKKIEVNHPLEVHGYSFFLKDLGLQPEEAVVTLEAQGRALAGPAVVLRLKVGEEQQLAGLGVRVQLVRFFPSFRTTGGQPVDMNYPLPDNPVALLRVSSETGPDRWKLLSSRFPEMDPAPEFPFLLRLKDYSVPVFLMIGYSHDAGFPLVWGGFVLVTAGLCAGMRFRYRRVWLTPKEGRVTLNRNDAALLGLGRDREGST